MANMSVRGIDHIVLRVRDIAKSIAWYECVLGAKQERYVSDINLHQLRLGAALIDLMPVCSDQTENDKVVVTKPTTNMDHFCVLLDCFDEKSVRDHLKRCGVQSGSVERRYGALGYGPSMYITDPDGNIVELKGPPELEPNRPAGNFT
tara:strand:- start:208 stop:651 length:444 start_codon:yes stop_codon:yes gene_type:complete